MFTGIVRHVGVVRQVTSAPGGKRLTVDLGPLIADLREGDSVAVSGVCLTVTGIRRTDTDFELVPETLQRTTLGTAVSGTKVNLERSLKVTDALDGHLVQGHVDGIAEVKTIGRGEHHEVIFTAAPELTQQMIPKGSVCIDGVSLTLVEVNERTLSVALIPATLEQTTLGELKPGVRVNVETDVIGKYVRKYIAALTGKTPGDKLTLEKLGEAGFL